MLVLRGVHVGGFSRSCGPQHQLGGGFRSELFKKIEIKITPCEISLFKENSASAFSPSAKFCDHYISLDTRQPFHPWKPCARQYPLPSPPCPPPSAATQLLHPCGLTCPGLCSGQNHADGSLCPAAFTQHSVCKAHLCCHMTSICLLFHSCIIVHCVNRRQAFKISCPLMDLQVVSVFWPLAICCHKHYIQGFMWMYVF